MSSYYLRIPTSPARYFKIDVNGAATIEEVDESETPSAIVIDESLTTSNGLAGTGTLSEAPYKESIDYYKGLLTSQYQNSTKFKNWLGAPLQMLDEIDTYLATQLLLFNIDLTTTAFSEYLGQMIIEYGGTLLNEDGDVLTLLNAGETNPVLDIIGIIVGQRRKVAFEPSDGVSPVLDDTTYRLLLKAKMAANMWDGKIESLAPIWEGLFPGGQIIVVDNLDMTMNVYVTGSFTSIITDLILEGYIVPKPMGVELNPTVPAYALFGWDRNDAYVAGWDTGKY